MYKRHEFCPKCQGIRSTTISVSLKKVVRLGETREVLSDNYHCDACLSFIYSIDREVAECDEVPSRMPAFP